MSVDIYCIALHPWCSRESTRPCLHDALYQDVAMLFKLHVHNIYRLCCHPGNGLYSFNNNCLPMHACAVQHEVSSPTVAALSRLVSLFGMFTVLRDVGEFLEDGYITGPMGAALREELYKV